MRSHDRLKIRLFGEKVKIIQQSGDETKIRVSYLLTNQFIRKYTALVIYFNFTKLRLVPSDKIFLKYNTISYNSRYYV